MFPLLSVGENLALGAWTRTDAGVDEDLEIYGLLAPRMTIHLEHGGEHGHGPGIVDLEIGDETPDSFSYYVRLVGTRRVYTVDRTWYEVMERLVLDPPYLQE